MKVLTKQAMLYCVLVCIHCSCFAKPITIASAANFKSTLERLVTQFEKTTATQVTIITASSGVLYTQISHGAAFDVFLSADASRPTKLAKFVY